MQDQRRRFFLWAIIAISGVLTFSAFAFVWYLVAKGSEIDSAVMIAWLSTSLLETLGLGYIIANYLFEGNLRPSSSLARRAQNTTGGKSGTD